MWTDREKNWGLSVLQKSSWTSWCWLGINLKIVWLIWFFLFVLKLFRMWNWIFPAVKKLHWNSFSDICPPVVCFEVWSISYGVSDIWSKHRLYLWIVIELVYWKVKTIVKILKNIWTNWSSLYFAHLDSAIFLVAQWSRKMANKVAK